MSAAGVPPIPLGTDLQADKGPRIISANIALIVLPTFFVSLRFISRHIARAGYWWDDALVTVALILSWGPCICIIVSEHINGFGKHLWALADPQQNTRIFLKMLYIYSIFYYLSLVTIKLAILAFYHRIFPLRRTLWIGWAVVLAYGLASILSSVFQCQPIHGFWDKSIPSHCDDGDKSLLVPGALNVVLDFLIIGLPVPLLWKLRTTTSQKSVLTGIFTCAGFVCIISIVRLIVLSRLTNFDVTWNFVDSAIWSAAEPCMGVVAACMPSLRPLLSLIIRGTHRAPTMFSRSAQNTTSTNSSRRMWSRRDKQSDDLDQVGPGGFARLNDAPLRSDKWGHDVHVIGGKENREGKKSTSGPGTLPDDQISLKDMVPQCGIRVQSEVVITTSAWEYKDRVF